MYFFFFYSHFPAVILFLYKYGTEGFEKSDWKIWHLRSPTRMLTGNIRGRNDLNDLQSSGDVELLEEEVVRK